MPMPLDISVQAHDPVFVDQASGEIAVQDLRDPVIGQSRFFFEHAQRREVHDLPVYPDGSHG